MLRTSRRLVIAYPIPEETRRLSSSTSQPCVLSRTRSIPLIAVLTTLRPASLPNRLQPGELVITEAGTTLPRIMACGP